MSRRGQTWPYVQQWNRIGKWRLLFSPLIRRDVLDRIGVMIYFPVSVHTRFGKSCQDNPFNIFVINEWTESQKEFESTPCTDQFVANLIIVSKSRWQVLYEIKAGATQGYRQL